VFDAERLLDGRKVALLVPALPADRYRTAGDAPWRARDDGFAHEQMVHAVSHFGRYLSVTGAPLSVRSLTTGRRYQVQITAIRMVECARLSDEVIRDLGCTSREAYDATIGAILHRRRAWLVHVIPLAPTATLH
jgi:hypothetical protein